MLLNRKAITYVEEALCSPHIPDSAGAHLVLQAASRSKFEGTNQRTSPAQSNDRHGPDVWRKRSHQNKERWCMCGDGRTKAGNLAPLMLTCIFRLVTVATINHVPIYRPLFKTSIDCNHRS